jgi:hypothetical protein
VAPGTSRLRLWVMANHRPNDLCAAASVIANAAAELGIAAAGAPRPEDARPVSTLPKAA